MTKRKSRNVYFPCFTCGHARGMHREIAVIVDKVKRLVDFERERCEAIKFYKRYDKQCECLQFIQDNLDYLRRRYEEKQKSQSSVS